MTGFLKFWSSCAEVMAICLTQYSDNKTFALSRFFVNQKSGEIQFLLSAGLLIHKGFSGGEFVYFSLPVEGWAYDYYFHDDKEFPGRVSPFTLSKFLREAYTDLSKYPPSEASLNLQVRIVREMSQMFDWRWVFRNLEEYKPDLYQQLMTIG